MPISQYEKQLIELKDTIKALHTSIDILNKNLEEANAREEAHIEKERILEEQVKYLTNKLYGSSSEKRSLPFPGQINLFDEVEVEATPDLEFETEDVSFKRKKKAKITNEEKYDGLPTVKKYEDVPEEERFCKECGAPLSPMGEELLRRELEFTPAKVRVVEVYSKTYVCNECKKHGIPTIVRGRDGKPHMIHGMASSSTVAWIMYQKFVNSIPLYRQERDWQLYGVGINRGTAANWIIKNAEDFFKPMCFFFRDHILSRFQSMADETPIQVLKEEGRTSQQKSYMWVFRTGEFLDKPAIVYIYAPTRSGHVAEEFFKDYDGYVMCDGFSGYNVPLKIRRVGCWAHARRYLLDAVPKKNQWDLSVPAMQGVQYINKLFEIEKKIHSKDLTFDQIKERRLREEKPLLEGLRSWLEKQTPNKGTKFYKAVIYLRNQWEYLTTYLEDGACSFSNNASERCCKDFVIGRKNWLFSDSTKGADASAYTYSVIQTAKANGVNIYHYLCFLLDNAAGIAEKNADLEKYAPWNEDVKAEVQRRFENSLI